jgi:hypothetical protein
MLKNRCYTATGSRSAHLFPLSERRHVPSLKVTRSSTSNIHGKLHVTVCNSGNAEVNRARNERKNARATLYPDWAKAAAGQWE